MHKYRLITNASIGNANEPEPRQASNAWRLFARLESADAQPASFCLLNQIALLTPSDRKAALGALHKLILVAATGDPLTAHYDKKQCHDIHEFNHPEMPPEKHVVYRIWKGAKVRLTFYYADGNRSILLVNAFAKSEDKLNRQQQIALEDEVKLYLAVKAQKNFKVES